MLINRKTATRVVVSAILFVALSACSSSDDNGDENDSIGATDTMNGTDDSADTSDNVNDNNDNNDNNTVTQTLIATCEAANATETASAADAPYFALAATRTPSFDAGLYERISVGEVTQLSGCTEANASSDNYATTNGVDLYGIGRFNQDNVTRFDVESLEADYQYSVVGADGVSSNPHDMVFVSETKAYIARYGTGEVWIVNPSATSQEAFFVGEIDLSAYDADGATDMTRMIIVGDQLFVLMQRLQSFTPTLSSYLAVIDTNTDTEIATGRGEEGLNGIQLPVRNGAEMFFNEATRDLVISAEGESFSPNGATEESLTGGVVLVDPDDYSVDVLIDDDTLGEFVNDVVIASPDKGYLLTTVSFGTASLRTFNPTTGVVEADPLAGYDGIDITALEVGPEGNVWVGVNDATEPGFDRLDSTDDSRVGERVRTELVPLNLVFITR